MAKAFLLTGLSGSGKTTLARAMCEHFGKSCNCVMLDGDEMQAGLCADLGFSREDREENLRRCGEMSRLLLDQGVTVFLALIAPYEKVRNNLSAIIGQERFRLIHVNCPLETCIARDPKLNYRKALTGLMPNYTGIGDTYESPEKPDLVLHTGSMSESDSIAALAEFVRNEI